MLNNIKWHHIILILILVIAIILIILYLKTSTTINSFYNYGQYVENRENRENKQIENKNNSDNGNGNNNYGDNGDNGDNNDYSNNKSPLKVSKRDLDILVVSALYNIPGKHSIESYKKFAANWMTKYNKGYLVVFCDDFYYPYVKKLRIDAGLMDRSIIIMLPIDELMSSQLYKKKWQDNYERMREFDYEYRKQIIWSEKLNFMYEAYKLIPWSKWIMWLDAGYFRDSENDPQIATNFPDIDKLNNLDKNKIYMIRIFTDDWKPKFMEIVNNKETGEKLARENISYDAAYIASGSVVLYYTKLYDAWYQFYSTLQHFMVKNRDILDDQLIFGHVIFDNKYVDDYELIKAPETYEKDVWFYMKDYLTNN